MNKNKNNNNNNCNQASTSNTQPNQSNTNIKCRYCKKFGHSIEECRKRIYNNNLRQNSTQGNGQTSEKKRAIPGNTSTHPTQIISAKTE